MAVSARTEENGSAPPLEQPGDITFVASYLDAWAQHCPDDRAITYIDYFADRKGVEHVVTWSELDVWTRAIAAKLQQITEPGDRVALLAPQSAEYSPGFIGTIRSHALSVPLFAPDLPGQGERLQKVVADCAPSAVLTTRDKLDLVKEFCAAHDVPESQIVVIEDYRDQAELAAAYVFPASLQLDDVAYLQYTSGSTRVPVGVCLTHRNIVENAMQLKSGYGLQFGEATTVSWLPLFHDMGLILGVAAPVIGRLQAVILDPVAFILKPARWLQAISGRANVMTAAPNFAFDYAVKRVREEDRAGLDLSGVIAWINGAEPVLPATVDRFNESFAPQGVTQFQVKPSYGLAEATVFVATTPLEEPQKTIEVDWQQLQHGIATTAVTEGTKPTLLVSCGHAIGQHLAIVDPETRELLPDGTVGEIWLNGANIGVGYWNRPEDTEALFNAKLVGGGDLPVDHWLRTEDLGVIVDGRLYVTGRIKDLIIIDGRNIYPHDVEYTVEEAHEVIAQRRLAAFSIPTDGGEALVVVAERYRHVDATGKLPDAAAAAREAVSREHAVALHDFVLVEPDTIPRTSSGKIARKASRTAYLAGELARSPE